MIKKPPATSVITGSRPVIHADGSSGYSDEANRTDHGSPSWDRMVAYLKAIGATHVLKDEGSFKVSKEWASPPCETTTIHVQVFLPAALSDHVWGSSIRQRFDPS